MPLRIANLRLSIDEPAAAPGAHLARLLGLAPTAIERWRILRQSLDARVKDAVHFVYTAEVATREDEGRLITRARRRHRDLLIDQHQDPVFVPPRQGAHPLK